MAFVGSFGGFVILHSIFARCCWLFSLALMLMAVIIDYSDPFDHGRSYRLSCVLPWLMLMFLDLFDHIDINMISISHYANCCRYNSNISSDSDSGSRVSFDTDTTHIFC